MNLPKLQMYLALQLNLGNELVVKNPVRDCRHSNHKQCGAHEEQNAQVCLLELLRHEGPEARYHRVLVPCQLPA